MLTIADIERRTNLCNKTIRRCIQTGRIEARLVDGHYLVDEKELTKLPKHKARYPNHDESDTACIEQVTPQKEIDAIYLVDQIRGLNELYEKQQLSIENFAHRIIACSLSVLLGNVPVTGITIVPITDKKDLFEHTKEG